MPLFIRTSALQVQAVMVASLTKLLCEPPTPALASMRHVSASSRLPQDTEGEPDVSHASPEMLGLAQGLIEV